MDGAANVDGKSMAWQRLAVPALVAVGLLNYLDRALPAVLAEPIKRDLALSDTFLGVVNGMAFLLVYAIAGIPIARVADRGRESAVIGAALGIWSLMTLAGAAVTSGWQMVLTRMGVALGEAGSLPASHAYLTRRYPPERRTLALSMLSLAVPLGHSLGLLVGSVLGRWMGWRITFVVIGGLGLAMAPAVKRILARADLTSSVQSGAFAATPRTLGETISLRVGYPNLHLILAGASLIAIGGYASNAFVPAFLMRVHGFSLQTVGIRYGLSAGVVGVAALLLTGWFSDRAVARGAKFPLKVVVFMVLAMAPFSAAAFLVQDADFALALAAIGAAIPVAYLAPVVASVHRLVPPTSRAQASALLLLCTAIVGSLGPLFVGMVSDALRSTLGAAALGRAALVIPVAYVMAGLVFWIAARRCEATAVSPVADSV